MNTPALKYDEKIEAAKRWLGDKYLLAQPINKPKTNSRRLVSEQLDNEPSLA
jgi:hypothetical protein